MSRDFFITPHLSYVTLSGTSEGLKGQILISGHFIRIETLFFFNLQNVTDACPHLCPRPGIRWSPKTAPTTTLAKRAWSPHWPLSYFARCVDSFGGAVEGVLAPSCKKPLNVTMQRKREQGMEEFAAVKSLKLKYGKNFDRHVFLFTLVLFLCCFRF
jgi:hypothetical protein